MKRFALVFLLSVFIPRSVSSQVYLNPQQSVEERVEDALSRMTLQEKIAVIHAQSKFTSAGVPRLGIRQLNMDDGPHGVREELEWNTWSVARWTNDSIVAFPSLTCLAATWNRELAAAYGNAISEEFAFRGKDVMLGPGVNIARTPMNGRAFEYMGEDPLLAGEMVVPYIQAVQKNGVACCLKHFVLNDQETDRFGVNVNVSERALHEIYLAPFRRAVEKAHVWSIMGSYNLWKGVHCCHNDELLNGILKRDWNWDGALISDWGGTTNTRQAATGGLDIEMGTNTDYNDNYLARPFRQLIEEGELPMSLLDEKVRRVLRLIFRTAMNPNKVIGSQCSEAHYAACREIGEEGIVLLKNNPLPSSPKGEGLLPLTSEKLTRLISPPLGGTGRGLKILVVGENATRSLTQGGGSSELKTLRDISPLEALRSQCSMFNSQPSTLNSQLSIDFAQGYKSGRAIYDKVDQVDPTENEQLRAEALAKAREADLIIFIGGMNKNHRQDCENGDRESYDLPFGQSELISEIVNCKSSNCKFVIVTFGGNPYAMPWIDRVDALVHCWYLGSEAGTALVNVLTGKVNPSGKLPVTFAKRYEDYPYTAFGREAYPGITGVKTQPNSANEIPHSQVYYKEGVFVGYRGFEKNKVQPLFPFGYGLSYTTFSYDKPVASRNADGHWTISVNVTNSGVREGKEVVQLYVGERKPTAANPVKELKDFVKLSLQPGETKRATFTIRAADLATWNETTHQWQERTGQFCAYVCASAADVKGTVVVKVEN